MKKEDMETLGYKVISEQEYQRRASSRGDDEFILAKGEVVLEPFNAGGLTQFEGVLRASDTEILLERWGGDETTMHLFTRMEGVEEDGEEWVETESLSVCLTQQEMEALYLLIGNFLKKG